MASYERPNPLIPLHYNLLAPESILTGMSNPLIRQESTVMYYCFQQNLIYFPKILQSDKRFTGRFISEVGKVSDYQLGFFLSHLLLRGEANVYSLPIITDITIDERLGKIRSIIRKYNIENVEEWAFFSEEQIRVRNKKIDDLFKHMQSIGYSGYIFIGAYDMVDLLETQKKLNSRS